ncbi:hypothetical protein [Vibrio fortis]|uniref:hypothetical protein n=1 Tax=Vibrio fortis TaxID=212667 RepID=UPI003EBC228C
MTVLISGCRNIDYDQSINHGELVNLPSYKLKVDLAIRSGLKDPDNLKNLRLGQVKCTLSSCTSNYPDGSTSW